MPIKNDREYRNMILEIKELKDEQDEMIVRGYASTFNDPYTLLETDKFKLIEVVDPDAFAETDMSDVIMQYDHQGRVFARMSNNTLSVTTDDHGLLIEANLGGTELGRQLYEEIKGGYTNKMSFGFTVKDDERQKTDGDDGKLVFTRTIKSVRKLYDVSAVSLPANDATEISVRNLSNGVIEQIQSERAEAEALELKRKKMLMRARLHFEEKN